MAHQVGGDLLEPVLVGDEMVLPGEAPRDRVVFVLAQARLVDNAGDLVAQLLVRQVQLGQPALVIERHRRAIRDGLGEVVDRHVIAEHLARALFLAGDERRAGEADKGGVRQRGAHVGGENVVLAAMRLVGDDDDVAAGRQHRIDFAARSPELLDEGEDVALVAAQQLLQVLAALRLHGLAQLRELPARREGSGDLVVEFGPVGDDEKRPVARLLAQNLSGEEQHGKALARALRMPEDAEPAPVVLDVVDGAAAPD